MKQEYVKLAIVASLVILIISFWKQIRRALKITWDIHTERRIKQLHPSLQESARAFINDAEQQGFKLRITSAFRSFAEQQALYDQGRKTPGEIVTNAKPGTSFHNYGLAIDVVEIKDGKGLWENTNWPKIAAIGKKHGFAWGGDWASFKDKPHFEKSFGFSTGQLLAKYENGHRTGEYVTLTA